MQRSAAEQVASVSPRNVEGTFYRHAAPNRDAFAGGIGGRWGHSFGVIYLGRPTDSVIVEAYRHLVEEAAMPAERVRPRTFYTVRVRAQRILDLTIPNNLAAAGLEPSDLTSDVDDYDACQRVAAAAHQLEMHGVLAPAATGVGETLALFTERLGLAEMPVVVAKMTWERLPADPRRLRIAESGEGPA